MEGAECEEGIGGTKMNVIGGLLFAAVAIVAFGGILLRILDIRNGIPWKKEDWLFAFFLFAIGVVMVLTSVAAFSLEE